MCRKNVRDEKDHVNTLTTDSTGLLSGAERSTGERSFVAGVGHKLRTSNARVVNIVCDRQRSQKKKRQVHFGLKKKL